MIWRGRISPLRSFQLFPYLSGMALAATDAPTMPTSLDTGDDLALAPDIGTIEQALVNFHRKQHQLAVGMHQYRKWQWFKYKQMDDGDGIPDDPDDPLVQLGLNLMRLSQLRNVMKAGLRQEFYPNNKCEFNLKAKIDGLNYYAEAATAGLRAKVKSMRPGSAKSFTELGDMWLNDLLGPCGQCLGIVRHEAAMGDANRDGSIQGPVADWIDPMNWWPDAYDVNSVAECNHYFFAPIDKYQLMAGNYVNLDEALATNSATETQRRDWDSYNLQNLETNLLWWQWTMERLYKRMVYIGRFPGEDLRDMGTGIGGATDEEMITTLAAEYGFDPATGMTAAWWLMEWLGNTLIRCVPYPLDVPNGACPVIHQGLFHRNGLLMAYGLWDYASWDARMLNFYHRACIHLTRAAMSPPFKYYPNMIDGAWLAEQEDETPQLVSGVGIPVTSPIPGVDPVEPMPFNLEVIPVAREQMAVHESNCRELTGITSALEGDDQSKTATQAQNNLQQSLGMKGYYSSQFGSFLIEVLAHCYVIWQQSLEANPGYSDHAPVDVGEQGLALVMISRHDLLDLTLIEIELTGPSSPGNRMNQSLVVDKLTTKYLMLGVLDPFDAAEAEFKLAGVDNILSPALIRPDMQALQMGMQQRLQTLGPGGAQAFTDPRLMRHAMQSMLPPPPMPGGPAGGPSLPGSGGPTVGTPPMAPHGYSPGSRNPSFGGLAGK